MGVGQGDGGGAESPKETSKAAIEWEWGYGRGGSLWRWCGWVGQDCAAGSGRAVRASKNFVFYSGIGHHGEILSRWVTEVLKELLLLLCLEIDWRRTRAETERPERRTYSFLTAVVTHYHQFSGLKQHTYIILRMMVRVTEVRVLKSRYEQDCVPTEGARGKFTSLTFPASENRLHLLALGFFLHL